MKKCILCNQTNLKVLTVQKRTPIFECKNCYLGVTKKISTSKNTLYKTTKFYSPELYQLDIDKHSANFEHVIERVRVFVEKGKVLDVGAGYGLFSALLSSEKRFDIIALEPNLKTMYLEKVKKIKSLRKTFEKYRSRNKSFSLITFLDTLEHFRDPLKVLKKASNLLKSNGYVVILFPNYKSVMRYVSKDWPWWMVEDHRYHFSRNSIRKILNQTGFKVEYIESFEGHEDIWISTASNFKGLKPALLRKVLRGILHPVLFALYFLLRPVFWYFELGGLLLVVAQKK